MSVVSFLLDEHVSPAVANAIRSVEPTIQVLSVGIDADAPLKQCSDQSLLEFAEAGRWSLVTFDKTTMPLHATEHCAKGLRTWGVFVFPNGNRMSAGRIAEELVMIWATSEAEEWIDRVDYLPF